MDVTSATPLWQVLMHRDGMTEQMAIDNCIDCRADLQEQLDDGAMPFDILSDWFGLEPDWNDDLATNPRYQRSI